MVAAIHRRQVAAIADPATVLTQSEVDRRVAAFADPAAILVQSNVDTRVARRADPEVVLYEPMVIRQVAAKAGPARESAMATPSKKQRSHPIGIGGRRFIEVCAGRAMLSAKVAERGFEALGVDHKFNKHVPVHDTIEIDLATDVGRDLLLTLCQESGVAMVWFGVPCGTASRAREIPLVNGPPPLRTEAEPWGAH